tara:strand:+ start:142 stop:894 length:753 start_codon:yes stop_codon:yes gene_type:complete
LSSKYYTIPPQIYDKQFWWKKDDVEFWKQIPSFKNKTILELAAGTGRLGIPLVREGFNYTGIELSSEYCEYANLKLKKWNNSTYIANDDMRTFNLNKQFDIIFIGFNSWLHLLTEEDVVKCLQSIKKHMNPDSIFYIDNLIPNPLFLYRPKDVALRVLEFEDSRNNMIYIDEMLDYDKSLEIANITWIYSDENNNEIFNFKFQMKMYYPDTMNRLLVDNGFSIQNIWGDYDKNKINEDSVLQIYECNILN